MNLFDKFIAEEVLRSADKDVIFRLRVIIATNLSMLPVLACAIFLPQSKYFTPENAYSFGVVVGALLLLLHALIPVLLKKTNKQLVLSHLTVLCVFFTGIVSLVMGGGTSHPATGLFTVVTPLAAMGTLKPMHARNWTVVVLSMMVTLVLMEQSLGQLVTVTTSFPGALAQSIQTVILALVIILICMAHTRYVFKLRDEMQEQKKALDYQATHDELTGLPNRALFYDRLTRAIARSKRQNGSFALLSLNIDDFGPLLKKFGRETANDVLSIMANRMLVNVRLADTVARMEDDEFAIILEQIHEVSDVTRVVSDLSRALAEEIDLVEGAVTASIGIALYPEHETSSDSLLGCATQALKQAKKQKNTWAFHATPPSVEA